MKPCESCILKLPGSIEGTCILDRLAAVIAFTQPDPFSFNHINRRNDKHPFTPPASGNWQAAFPRHFRFSPDGTGLRRNCPLRLRQNIQNHSILPLPQCTRQEEHNTNGRRRTSCHLQFPQKEDRMHRKHDSIHSAESSCILPSQKAVHPQEGWKAFQRDLRNCDTTKDTHQDRFQEKVFSPA